MSILPFFKSWLAPDRSCPTCGKEMYYSSSLGEICFPCHRLAIAKELDRMKAEQEEQEKEA